MKLKRARENADTEPPSSSGTVDDFAARLAQHGEQPLRWTTTDAHE